MRNLFTSTVPPSSAPLTGLAAYLVRDQLLDHATAQQAQTIIAQKNISLTYYLVQSGILSSQTILDYCLQQFELPFFDLKTYDITQLQQSCVTFEFIYRYRLLPLKQNSYDLYIGMTDPTDEIAIAAVRFHTELRIHSMLVAEDELEKIISLYCRPTIFDAQLESALSNLSKMAVTPDETQPPPEQLHQDSEPIIELVDSLLKDAIDKQISDIHLEPYETYYRIRFRRDGLLYENVSLPAHLAMPITMRLKIMAKLNIAERRLPQDGHIHIQKNASTLKTNIRINTCPVLFGEKIVLRILDENTKQIDIDILGLSLFQKNIFLQKLSQPQGLILVTGPTGSGKTMTLYAALRYLNQIEKNILSVEDPVEIELPGINQVNIHPKIGLDFAIVLRAFLRQDPDIIMVGEIRDAETAMIAMQAAQTGHLVLSTLHTNSAAETMVRLQSMGMSAYRLITSISLIVAQRLLRKLCSHCKQPEMISTSSLSTSITTPTTSTSTTSAVTVYQAVGCEYCHHGYHGRIGIFECLPMQEELAQLILSGADVIAITHYARKQNWTLLKEAALEKIRDGVTSNAEVMRVLGE